jgi:hypothetical protein
MLFQAVKALNEKRRMTQEEKERPKVPSRESANEVRVA